jgi:hypothetical protein
MLRIAHGNCIGGAVYGQGTMQAACYQFSMGDSLAEAQRDAEGHSWINAPSTFAMIARMPILVAFLCASASLRESTFFWSRSIGMERSLKK